LGEKKHGKKTGSVPFLWTKKKVKGGRQICKLVGGGGARVTTPTEVITKTDIKSVPVQRRSNLREFSTGVWKVGPMS